jgi:hypothetical protein
MAAALSLQTIISGLALLTAGLLLRLLRQQVPARQQ